MAEVNLELVLKRVEDVLAEQRITRAEQEALTHKVGAVATSMVSMMKRFDNIDHRMDYVALRLKELADTTQLIAVAVDDHTHRLNQIEQRLGIGTPPN